MFTRLPHNIPVNTLYTRGHILHDYGDYDVIWIKWSDSTHRIGLYTAEHINKNYSLYQ